jgi:hypothetical protein
MFQVVEWLLEIYICLLSVPISDMRFSIKRCF